MIKLGKALVTPIATLVTGIVTYVITSICFRHASIPWGPDTENILGPLFFDISRSIHNYGLLAGTFDPGQVAGLSLLNTPYFHPLYPFYFNWLGTDGTIFDTIARLKLVDLLHLSIYAAGSYLLCRSIGVRHWLAFAAGLTSPWLPAVHSLLNWPQILGSFAWIPWVIACQVFLYRSPNRPAKIANIILLGVTFSLLVYAQPAQNMVLAIVGSAIIWLAALVHSIRTGDPEKRRDFYQTTLSIAIAGVIAIILCGSYLLQVTIYLSGAIRWIGSAGAIIGMHRLPLSALREYALHWHDVSTLMVYTPGNPTIPGNLYIGAPLIAAVIFVIASIKRDSIVRAVMASTVIAFAFCFWIFAPVLQWIPVANKVRELSWWSCYVVATVVPIAAYGIQQALNLNCSRDENTHSVFTNRKLRLLVVFACFVAATALFIFERQINAINFVVTYVGLGLLLAGVACRSMKEHFRQLLGAAVILSSAATPAIIYIEFPPERPLLVGAEHIETRKEAAQIASQISDGDNFRFAVSPKLPNYRNLTVTLSNLGLRGIRGDISPQNNDKFRLLFFPSPAVSALYGVKYEVVQSAEHVSNDRPTGEDIYLHINDRALPRLFFVHGGVKVVDSPVDALLAVSGDSPLQFFVASRDVPRNVSLTPYTSGPPYISFPSIVKNEPVSISATLTSPGDGLLVLNEDPSAHWRATIDGKNATPIRINGFQTAFPVTGPGHHHIEIGRPTHLF